MQLKCLAHTGPAGSNETNPEGTVGSDVVEMSEASNKAPNRKMGGEGSSKRLCREYGGSLRRVRCQANGLAYASTLGWMQVEPKQRNAHPTEDHNGSMNLPTSVEERVNDGVLPAFKVRSELRTKRPQTGHLVPPGLVRV